jgi:hypothetical protein
MAQISIGNCMLHALVLAKKSPLKKAGWFEAGWF